MENHGASEEFGKELGLVHEVVITGRKVGADKEFWKALAHDQKLFQSIVENVKAYQLAIIRKMVIEWEELYREDGIKVDFSNLRIPEHKQGLDRLIIIPKGLKIQQAYDNLAKHFQCRKVTENNLDEVVTKNERDSSNESYAIWVWDLTRANKELPELLVDLELSGITLLEMLQYLRKYRKVKGQYLNCMKEILCLGSRFLSGRVPGVRWNDEWMSVLCYDSATVNFYRVLGPLLSKI
jgi:hypothetical protein